ncbi:hypothetical protein [Sneathiella glossodoripedis]|uniref:hypothetical protein n=1 Tax=Sneathiella glossodoripedis TaxID=418853 RepID=UPI00047005DD|nr:hypothetical protein [Sneathiella glossodoripedis]
MDKFTEVRKLDFDPDYNTVKVISVNADTTTNRLSVLFDGKCEVKLRKTGKQVIADNFKGKRASNTAINVSKDMTNTVQPVETDFSPLNGNWKGFAGSGCVYFMANPADVTVRASIRDNTFKMQLSHQYNFGSDRGKGLRAEDKLPSHGELIFDPEYNEVNFVKVKADPVRRNVSIHFNPGCTVNLQRTDEKTIPDGFRGKKATTKKAEYFS